MFRLLAFVLPLGVDSFAVAAALGLPSRAESYELAAAFITRKPVPAAFVTGPFPFASLPELFTVLAAD